MYARETGERSTLIAIARARTQTKKYELPQRGVQHTHYLPTWGDRALYGHTLSKGFEGHNALILSSNRPLPLPATQTCMNGHGRCT